MDRHKPSISGFRDTGTQDFATKTQLLCHVDPSQFWDIDPVNAYCELVIGKVKGQARVLFALELGKSNATAFFGSSKKFLKSLLYIHESSLNNTLCCLVCPRKLFFANSVELLFERQRVRLFSRFILLLLFGQAPVENEPGCSCSTGEYWACSSVGCNRILCALIILIFLESLLQYPVLYLHKPYN